ncbi:MAG: FAD-binding protein [Lachnospiraceae bacterium]|nr:FAD-binding protein [Lachnospiraceae bacterium]
MILNEVKVPVRYTEADLLKAVRKASGKKRVSLSGIRILRKSIDARKKPDLYFVLKVALDEPAPDRFSFLSDAERERGKLSAFLYGGKAFASPVHPAAVVGAGPAGLFAALTISTAGIPVILFERGQPVETRKRDVQRFFETGELNPESNVQFGEGGAGTFSDGKLNTRSKDPEGLKDLVLRTFCDAGASPSILTDTRAHIGTDVLENVLKGIRARLLENGCRIRCGTKITGFSTENGHISALYSGEERIPVSACVLAIGHSARDTYRMLYDAGVPMAQKPFALGVRMEHLQDSITMDQYGTLDYEELGAAPYAVTAATSSGRGVYSFCMCPGGYVVNASSEPGHLAVNGMSYQKRDGRNANAGIVVQVRTSDYPSSHPLAGIEYQREIERRAYLACGGKIPVQRYEDFAEDRMSDHLGTVTPQMKGAYGFGLASRVLPEELYLAIREAVPAFGRMIRGFDDPDALVSCVESRTSSPVRILRDERYESAVKGLYPAGEGAGYAGGIMSAAVDGIRAALSLLGRYGTEQEGTDENGSETDQ